MLKVKKHSELESDQIVIPDAYIIDELTDKGSDSNFENGLSIPHYYDLDSTDQAPSTRDDHQSVIIIEI